MAEQPPPPLVLPTMESRVRRYKLLWRSLLISNLAFGAYIFYVARQKETELVNKRSSSESESKESKAVEEKPSLITTAPISYAIAFPLPIIYLPKFRIRQPVTEDQQRELFHWMLEEKRKIKPKDSEEKRRIDEEKAILKQFIRAKSVPHL